MKGIELRSTNPYQAIPGAEEEDALRATDVFVKNSSEKSTKKSNSLALYILLGALVILSIIGLFSFTNSSSGNGLRMRESSTSYCKTSCDNGCASYPVSLKNKQIIPFPH